MLFLLNLSKRFVQKKINLCATIILHAGLTENEVVAQSILFLLAGFESTASTLSFATYCLAVNPECQDKLYKEVLAVVGDKVPYQPVYIVNNSNWLSDVSL